MFADLTNLLSSSQGSMAYHMVLSFVLLNAIAVAINHSIQNNSKRNRRRVLGLVLLILIRILLFIVAGLGSHDIVFKDSLPIVNRLADTFTIVVIFWIWAFPQPARKEDIISITVGIMILIGGVVAILIWNNKEIAESFNNTRLSFFWSLFNIALLLVGELILIIRQPNQLSLGLIMVTTLLVGEIGQTIFPNEINDYPFWVRLTQLATFPLLLSIPYDSPLHSDHVTDKTHPTSEITQKTIPKEMGNTGVDQGVFRSTLLLLNAESKDDICISFCRFIAQSLVADICLILYPQPSKGRIVLGCGYDLIVQERVQSKSFEQTTIPGLATAISHSKPLIYPYNSPELNKFRQLLLLREIGHFLAVPIYDADEPICVIVLLSPYSKHEWTLADQQYLSESSPEIVAIVQKSIQSTTITGKKPDAPVLPKDDDKLLNELAVLQAQNASYEEQLSNLKKLGEDYSESLKTIQSLKEDKKKLALILENGGADMKDIITEVRPNLSSDQAEVISSISQELRQPITSIIGYTDLLLSESVGVLEDNQRKFLDHIKASSGRINSMVSDLIKINALESGKSAINPESIELSEIIDEIIAQSSSQIREKEIVLRVDLPDQLPKIYSDKDAVKNILLHLLENAIAATPSEKEIRIQAALINNNNDDDSIQLSISDSGEGIPQEEIPRVFSRLYRADEPLIPGVGDKGVGLSIAKSLTEELGGEIWVESVDNKGSTFHFILPLQTMGPEKDGASVI